MKIRIFGFGTLMVEFWSKKRLEVNKDVKKVIVDRIRRKYGKTIQWFTEKQVYEMMEVYGRYALRTKEEK